MIQRIQTVYMFLAVLMMVVCLCLPIGTLYYPTMCPPDTLYNLCIINGADHSWNFSVAGLFALLAASAVTTVINIFSFKNLRAQKRDCLIGVILLLLWVALYAFEIYMMQSDGGILKIGYSAILPILAIAFLFLARRGVIHDDKLLRSVDRIR